MAAFDAARTARVRANLVVSGNHRFADDDLTVEGSTTTMELIVERNAFFNDDVQFDSSVAPAVALTFLLAAYVAKYQPRVVRKHARGVAQHGLHLRRICFCVVAVEVQVQGAGYLKYY